MPSPRHSHSANLLPNGKVLISGGVDDAWVHPGTSELFDPATSSWSAAGNMLIKRRLHRTVLLPNGKVLAVGGANTTATSLPSIELYQPATDNWVAGASMVISRVNHAVALLADGRVLVVGGASGSPQAQVYDPTANSWTSTPTTAPRVFATATLLPNGQVLVVGGFVGGGPVGSVELFDPAATSWTAVSSLLTARARHTATILPNGKVLVVGGQGLGALSSAELYDPLTNLWTPAGSMAVARYSHVSTLLPSGTVLVTGGSMPPLASAELYDAATDTWKSAATMTIGRVHHTATHLPNGKVLVAGGELTAAVPWAELYSPKTAGIGCATATACPSGHCVDAVCCDTACNGACDSCDLPSSPGICTHAPAGSSGSPACSPQACSGSSSSCPSSCLVDLDCAVGHYCAAGSCGIQRVRGAACTSANQCVTGICADAKCCNSECSAACDACDTQGTCVPSPGAAGTPSCMPYRCAGASVDCPTSCMTNQQCVATHTCDAGVCVLRAASGSPCSFSSECGSMFCVEGVCCDRACVGSCESCSLPGSVGRCSTSPKDTGKNCGVYLCDGISTNCPRQCTGDAGCLLGFRCNGSACLPKLSDGFRCTSAGDCHSNSCADGVCCGTACTGGCDSCIADGGMGTCLPRPEGFVGDPSCAPYLCRGAHACPAGCERDFHCIATHVCVNQVCVEKSPPGSACVAGNTCASGNCADGVCCDNKCSGGCDVCNLPGTVGTCTLLEEGATGTPSCAPYLCGSVGKCRGTCTTDAHCVPPNRCSGGFCTTQPVSNPGARTSGCGGCQSSGAAPFFALLFTAAAILRGRGWRADLRARFRRGPRGL